MEKETFFAEEKKKREGKGGKYLEKKISFCRGEGKQRRKGRKIYFFEDEHQMRPG